MQSKLDAKSEALVSKLPSDVAKAFEDVDKLKWIPFFNRPEDFPVLLDELKTAFPPERIEKKESPETRCWSAIGFLLRAMGRHYEAIVVYNHWYSLVQTFQLPLGRKGKKGVPLFWLWECYRNIGNTTTAKYHLMLALIEDAIDVKGDKEKIRGWGSYSRLIVAHGMTDWEIRDYVRRAHEISLKMGKEAVFPESILLQIGDEWLVEKPTPNDECLYIVNERYISYLKKLISKKQGRPGKNFERLAHYLVSRIPGCRVIANIRTPSTEHDLVCSFDGPGFDFRSEVGRYFICECKDWSKPANFTSFAKFARVLDSVRARFGILFSSKGITGKGTDKDARRAQEKLFVDRGIIVVVVDEDDIERIYTGMNFVSLLRKKYEALRLDIDERRI